MPRTLVTTPRKKAGQTRSADTIKVILEAAARILEERGLAGYNTNAIAERAGVSIGSLYQYFPNKHAITRALIERFEREMLGACEVAARAAKGLPLADATALLVGVVVDQHGARPTLNRILEDEEARLFGDAPENGGARNFVEAFLEPYRAQIAAPLDEVARDVLTVARALADATLREGSSRADSERRIGRAISGCLG